MNVLEMAKKLNREFKNDTLSIRADVTPTYERCACGDLGMDFPLYGGLPEGRVAVFSGKEHSGKTTAAITYMAAYQKKYPNKVCVFVDVEHSLDLQFMAHMTGIDWSRVQYVDPVNISGEQVLDIIDEFLTCDDIGLIILDSVAALCSSADYESDVEEDKGQRASIAKALNKFLKKILDKLSATRAILIMINQVREKGKTFTGATIYDEVAGSAPKFYSSVTVRFGKRAFTDGDTTDKTDGEKTDGFRLNFAIIKNKTASTQRGGGFLTYRYDTGLDWLYDTLEVALKYNFISRPNKSRYELVNLESGEIYLDKETNEPLSFVGKDKVKEYFTLHPDFQTEYVNMLIKHISSDESNSKDEALLDKKILDEIKEEDAGVLNGGI